MDNNNLTINSLLSTIHTLRGENGCPWDKKQTAESLKRYLNEEVEELLSAIDNDDATNICEEIGDVLYVLVMLAEIHAEKQLFTFSKCITDIDAKLKRRHPHVFAGKEIGSEDQLRRQWQEIKEQEKRNN